MGHIKFKNGREMRGWWIDAILGPILFVFLVVPLFVFLVAPIMILFSPALLIKNLRKRKAR